MPARYLGSKTLSITWITPLDWRTAAMVTAAEEPLSSVIVTIAHHPCGECSAVGRFEKGLSAAGGDHERQFG